MQSIKTVTAASNVLFQELADEAVLLNLVNEHYYGLDEVGTRIWQLIGEHDDVEQVVAHLLAEYDVPAATLRQDITALLAEMATAGLVTLEMA